MYSVLHSVSKVCLGTCSTTSVHSCLVAGAHIIAHLARLIDVIADLLGNGLTDIPLSCSALTVAHFLGLYGWDQRTHASWLLLTILNGNFRARPSVQILTLNLRHLDTLELGDISTLLLREAATLSVGNF